MGLSAPPATLGYRSSWVSCTQNMQGDWILHPSDEQVADQGRLSLEMGFTCDVGTVPSLKYLSFLFDTSTNLSHRTSGDNEQCRVCNSPATRIIRGPWWKGYHGNEEGFPATKKTTRKHVTHRVWMIFAQIQISSQTLPDFDTGS